jgi:hypothetical protein
MVSRRTEGTNDATRIHFEGIGHRQQVVSVSAIDAAPAEVVGKPRGPGPAHRVLRRLRVPAVEQLRGAEVHWFEIDDRLLLKDVAVVGDTQSDTDAVVRESVKAISRHSFSR